MNAPTYRNSSDLPNGDGAGVSTSPSRTLRLARSRMRPVSAGTSNTSCTHSRTVSSTTGKVPYLAATASRCADRCRCCQSGERRPGWRRGSSSARAAHSRNRDANSAEPPSSAVISGSSSSASNSAMPAGGGSSVSGTRSTIPSSVCSACTSMSW